MAKHRFAYRPKFAYQERFFDAVFLYDGSVYTDLTEAARNPTAGDVTATGSSTNHILYLIMKDAPVKSIYAELTTIAAGGTRAWKYWNGTAFTVLADGPVMFRQNQHFTATTDHIVMAAWYAAAVVNEAKTTVNGVHGYVYALQVASTTNSPVFSKISARTIFASSEEIVLPAAHAGMNSPADVWKSRHETIEIVKGKNDKFNYNIGGGELTLTLTPGEYRPAAAASHIETLLGVGFTGTFSNVTGYAFTSASGTFQLLCATGTDKATSIFPTLGFNCSSNKTGALTYTSGRLRKSSGGTYTITAANKNFRFTGTGARNINLTEGTFSGGSLQSMLKAAMDSAEGVSDYDPYFNEGSNAWTVYRAGGNISIDAGGTFPAVLGLAVAGSAASHSGTAIHTGEWLVLVSHSAVVPSVDDFVGLNHNLSASAVITSEEYSGSGNFTNPETWTYGTQLYAKPSPAHASNIVRVNIEDKTNSDGYIQIGFIGAFDFGDGYFETSLNIKEHPSKTTEGFEDISQSSSGQITATLLGTQTVKEYEMFAITTADTVNLETMQGEIGIGTPFLFIMDRDLANGIIIEQMIWGRLEQRLKFSEIDKAGLRHSTNNLIIKQFL